MAQVQIFTGYFTLGKKKPKEKLTFCFLTTKNVEKNTELFWVQKTTKRRQSYGIFHTKKVSKIEKKLEKNEKT